MSAWWEWLIIPFWLLLYLAVCLVLAAVLAAAIISKTIRNFRHPRSRP